MKKILVIVFNLERAREHEWFVEYLNKDLYDMQFALINKTDSYMHEYLTKNSIKVHKFKYSGKHQLLSLIYGLYKLIRRNNFDIVHAHLFEATLSGMIASFLAKTPSRIVTRHYSDFHHVFFPSAVKYDKLINYLATRIVAVSKNVENILISREGVEPSKVTMIHHGVDVNDFEDKNISFDRIDSLRNRYDIPKNKPVVGVISRFIYLKGLQYIIPAFEKVLIRYPDAILVLANAQGPYSKEVFSRLERLNPSSYRLIDFEPDIAALYKLFYCFVHVPISETIEAFGQIYIEALAARVPSVFTKSGVAAEFAVNNENCLVVPFENEESITEAVCKILNNDFPVDKMVENGYLLVKEHFNVQLKYEKIQQMYAESE